MIDKVSAVDETSEKAELRLRTQVKKIETPSKALEREINHYKARTPESAKRQNEAAGYLPGGSSRDTIYCDPYPIFFDHGKGLCL